MVSACHHSFLSLTFLPPSCWQSCNEANGQIRRVEPYLPSRPLWLALPIETATCRLPPSLPIAVGRASEGVPLIPSHSHSHPISSHLRESDRRFPSPPLSLSSHIPAAAIRKAIKWQSNSHPRMAGTKEGRRTWPATARGEEGGIRKRRETGCD